LRKKIDLKSVSEASRFFGAVGQLPLSVCNCISSGASRNL